RSDRLFAHALRADLGIILVRMNNQSGSQVFERGRKAVLCENTHLVAVELLDMIDPVHELRSDGLIFRFRDEIERVNHVIGVEFRAVVELHAFAQFKFERRVVDPLPGCRELPFVCAGFRVAIDQRIPNMVGQDHANAHVIEIGVEVVEGLFLGEADRIVALAGERRRREGKSHDKSYECGYFTKPCDDHDVSTVTASHQIKPHFAAQQFGRTLQSVDSYIAVLRIEKPPDLAATRTHTFGEALTRKPLCLHSLGYLPGQNFLDGDGLKRFPGALLIKEFVQRRTPMWILLSLFHFFISFIRLFASVIASAGVFWVFLIKPCTTPIWPASTKNSTRAIRLLE